MSTIQSVRGTKDIVPSEIPKWWRLEGVLRSVSDQFGFAEIRTPIFEKTEVFARGVGDNTDIVNKEMYTFTDRGGESLTLRPEQTAAVVRCTIQNKLLATPGARRFFYIGSYFRYERPQKGRLREFHQYGAELINSPYPESDVEVILLAIGVLKRLEFEDYSLKLNSLGNDISRDNYRQALVKFLNENKSNLSNDSQVRMEANPLRVLDSKDAQDIEIVRNAPQILDYLDAESIEHFDKVKSMLSANNINYEIVPNLVRGLDYYSHTVFEFQSTYLGAQDSFGGGGRYNKLFAELGGGDVPAVGFAMGMERLLLILEQIDFDYDKHEVDIVVVPTSEQYIEYAMKVVQLVRDLTKKTSATVDVNRRSLKAQLREANKLNAMYAFIIGETEYNTQTVTVKNMTEDEEQKTMTFEEVAKWMKKDFLSDGIDHFFTPHYHW